jgi:hypothetical protein
MAIRKVPSSRKLVRWAPGCLILACDIKIFFFHPANSGNYQQSSGESSKSHPAAAAGSREIPNPKFQTVKALADIVVLGRSRRFIGNPDAGPIDDLFLFHRSGFITKHLQIKTYGNVLRGSC